MFKFSFFKKQKTNWKFEYFQSPKNKKWYFRMKALNGEIVFSSRQAYSNLSDCLDTMNSIIKNTGQAEIKNVTKK